jgi:hypothetical protein
MRTLTALAVVAALIVLPQDPVSAACSWNASPLALPAGYVMVKPTAQAGAGLIVGKAYRTNLTDGTNHAYGVVWRDGVPQILPKPPVSGEGSNSPAGVNASGVIAGMWHGTGGGISTPWRYQNGTYQLLPMPVTQVTWYAVTGINAAGDVVGKRTYFYGSRGLLWRADSPSQVTDLGPAGAMGIDAQRRVVLSNGTIINPDGSQITVQGGGVVVVRVFSGGRILGDRYGVRTIIEWNLSGQEVRQLPGGLASTVNTAGTVVGESDVVVSGQGYKKAVWFNGVRELAISPRPFENPPAITDDNGVIGEYDADGNTNWAGNAGVIWRRSC